MVTNFEEITCELTDKEMKLLPYLINGLKTKTKDSPIKAPEIIKKTNLFLISKSINNVRLSEPRLRKMINHLRANGILPVIATSKGYYVSYETDDLLLQILSLTERANSIRSCAEGLKFFLSEVNPQHPNLFDAIE
jgi:hypothetical protein